MLHISSMSTSISLALVAISMVGSSYADIVGCDAVGCPLDKYNQTQCTFGNMTARIIGISTFNNSLLSPQPLTWTIGVQALEDQQTTVERDFFLGSARPIGTRASASSQIQTCSLFFDGISSKLRFPGTDPEYDQGTCNNALTAACVNDLRTQSEAELRKLISTEARDNSSNTMSTCDRLGNALRDNAPASCAIAANRAWGAILSRSLTPLSNGTAPLQGDCHPTTGANYDIISVAASLVNLPNRSTMELRSALFGITPIMTLAFSDDGAQFELDLTCLKTIGSKATKASEKESKASVLRSSGVAILFLAIALSSVVGL
ncbi:MAG: hypothetical protein Q9206_005659 [Seirophora lacunosa]